MTKRKGKLTEEEKSKMPGIHTRFTSEKQPEASKKGPRKFLTEALVKALQRDGKVEISGWCEEFKKKVSIEVIFPSLDIIILALLQKAQRGDVRAIREIFERTEGRVPYQVETIQGGPTRALDELTDEELIALTRDITDGDE